MLNNMGSKFVNTIDGITDVFEGTAEKVLPYIIPPLIWPLAKNVNISFLSLEVPALIVISKTVNLFLHSSDKPLRKRAFNTLSKLRNCTLSNVRQTVLDLPKILSQRLEIANKRWKALSPADETMTIGFFAINNLFFVDIFYHPRPLSHHIAIDSLLLGTSLLGSAYATFIGLQQIFKGIKSKQDNWKERISHISSGIILTTVGITSLSSSIQTIDRYFRGFEKFKTMTDLQQEGAIKHGAIPTLDEPHTCKAVIIDGVSSTWGGDARDNSPMPSSKFIYEKCDTIYFRAFSPQDFCSKLETASNKLGENINVLALNGHANPTSLSLHSIYSITKGSHQEFDCMRKYLASNAQVLINGCNVASVGGSLVRDISLDLPGREVSGPAAYLNSMFTTSSYVKGRFKQNSHFPFALNVWGDEVWEGPFNTKTFLNGREIEG